MAIDLQLDDPAFLAGIVVARQVRVGDSPPELLSRLQALVATRASEAFPPEKTKEAIRAMLRRGGFRPAGRNKPASEYLAQASREGRFPLINNLVDINNLISLQSGLPISMLDGEAVGAMAEIRYGRPGERYVFNPAGQDIDLDGLVCICRLQEGQTIPLGNPVKDSMEGKLKPQTHSIVAVVYASAEAISDGELKALLTDMADLVERHAAGAGIELTILGRQASCG